MNQNLTLRRPLIAHGQATLGWTQTAGFLRDQLQGSGVKLKQLLEVIQDLNGGRSKQLIQTGQRWRYLFLICGEGMLTLPPILPGLGGVVCTAVNDPLIALKMMGLATYDASKAVSAGSYHTPHRSTAPSGSEGLATEVAPAFLLTMTTPMPKNSLGLVQVLISRANLVHMPAAPSPVTPPGQPRCAPRLSPGIDLVYAHFIAADGL